MCFKMSLCLVLLLSACNWWGGDSKEDTKVYFKEKDFLGDSGSCVEETNAFFSQYFEGHSLDRDIDFTFNCIEDVVDKIFKHSKENSEQQGFSKNEVSVVFKSIFPNKDKKEIDDNVNFLFVFKRLVVGGDSDGFTRQEWERIKTQIPEISDSFKLAKKDISVFFYDRLEDYFLRNPKFKNLERAFKKLDSIKNKMGGELSEAEGQILINYIFDGRSYMRFKALAEVGKKILFSSGEIFKNSQKEFFERIFFALEMQSRFGSVKFIEGFLMGTPMFDLQRALLVISSNLKKWSDEDERYQLDAEVILELIHAVKKAGLLESFLKDTDAVSMTLNKVLKRLFKEEVYTSSSLKSLDELFNLWSSNQNRIFKKYNFKWLKDYKNPISEPIKEISKPYSKPNFLSDKDQPIVYNITDGELTAREEYFDETFKNILKVLVDKFISSYTKSEQGFIMRGPYLTKDTLGEIYNDIRPLGLDIGIVNPYKCNSHERAAIEMDSLTLNGNGNALITSNEMSEWLGLMLSVSSISSHLFEKFEPTCSYEGLKNLGFPFMERSCVEDLFFKRNRELARFAPSLLPYLEILSSPLQKSEFQDKLSSLTGLFHTFEQSQADSYTQEMTSALNECGHENFPYSRNEFNTSLALMFYVENVFHLFDTEGKASGWFAGVAEGADHIMDGREISRFALSRFDKMLDFLVDKSENSLVNKDRVKWLIQKAPRNSIRIDRHRVYSIISQVLSFQPEESKSEMIQRFCSAVHESQKTSYISFDEDEKMMCEKVD